MGFNHRKLFLDSQSIEISEFCSFYCDSSKNKNGTCPELCIPRCRTTCLYSLKPTSSPPLPPADPPTPTLSPHPSTLLYRIIALCILAAIFLLFCCYTIYKSARRSSSSSQPQQEQETHDDFLDEDHGPVLDHPIWYIRTIGLNPLIINSIPVCKYKRSDGLVEGTECSVCLNEFQEDETLRLLPKCNHVFHIDCIDIWLRSHTNCPICRAGIVINPARLPTPSPEQSVENSVVWEDTQVMISEGGGETEVRSELQVETGEKSHETAKEELVDEVRQMRRSVSVDSSSTSVIDAAMANPHSGESDGNSSSQLVKVKESNMGIVPNQVEVNQSLLTSMGDSSIRRSLQKGPILMKRSVSCNGLVLLSPHG